MKCKIIKKKNHNQLKLKRKVLIMKLKKNKFSQKYNNNNQLMIQQIHKLLILNKKI